MGGAAPTPSGKGGKKPLDASLNLVPFIDLLSCCISFLLITAVWTQLARMDVTQKGQSSAGAVDEKPPENVVQLTLFIDKDGYTFAKSTGENTPIPKKGEEYDYAKLADILKDAKTAYPDKNDIMVKSDDDVMYNNIIRTMDVVLSNKFPDVSLGDKGAGS
ncbi:MAG: Biopolymer transport protein [Myxococcales bacterium]|nr:Biopolymer transport protein [Myxococcales bacterium]